MSCSPGNLGTNSCDTYKMFKFGTCTPSAGAATVSNPDDIQAGKVEVQVIQVVDTGRHKVLTPVNNAGPSRAANNKKLPEGKKVSSRPVQYVLWTHVLWRDAACTQGHVCPQAHARPDTHVADAECGTLRQCTVKCNRLLLPAFALQWFLAPGLKVRTVQRSAARTAGISTELHPSAAHAGAAHCWLCDGQTPQLAQTLLTGFAVRRQKQGLLLRKTPLGARLSGGRYADRTMH